MGLSGTGFDYGGHRVENRTLISADPKDAARWVTPFASQSEGPPMVNANGQGTLDDYDRVLPSSAISQKGDKATEAAVKHFETQLKDIMKAQGLKAKNMNSTQLRLAAQALYGVYGPNATLTGLDPALVQAVEQHPQFQDNLHLNSTDDHVFEFLLKDGVYPPNQKADFIRQYGEQPSNSKKVNALSSRQLKQKETELLEHRENSHEKRMKNRELSREQEAYDRRREEEARQRAEARAQQLAAEREQAAKLQAQRERIEQLKKDGPPKREPPKRPKATPPIPNKVVSEEEAVKPTRARRGQQLGDMD